MGRREMYRRELRAVDDWARFLGEHSGLPGPRGNIELAQAAADEGSAELFDAWIATGDEYLTFCGVLGLGRLFAEGSDVEARLRAHAADPRWRVREAVATALQRLEPPEVMKVATSWIENPDPLVKRAAMAAICEPRLLTTPEAAACAREVCAAATRWVAEGHKGADARVLRQALGYGWSVAVAADPGPGLAAFLALEREPGSDVAWIVRENRKKTRLAKLL